MKKIILSLLFILLTLTACGAKSEATYDTAFATEEMSSDSFGIDNGLDINSKQSDRKIIVTGDLSINATNIKNVIEKINEAINKYDAYVISSNESNYSDYQYASVTVRIPADKFNDFIDDLKNENNVTNLSINSDDITDTYIDSEARLNNLKIQEERLLEILKQAETVSDIITIESELTNVRSNIEYYETTLKNYDKQVEYSTLYINVSSSVKETSYSFTSRIKDALGNTFNSFINIIQDIVIFLIYAIPYIVVIVIVVVVIIKIKKKRKKNIQ